MEPARWEYKAVQRNSSNLRRLVADLNDLGADGWEVVGFASADKTLGLNSIMAVLRRPWDGQSPRVGVDVDVDVEDRFLAQEDPDGALDPTGGPCDCDGCAQPATRSGLCALHELRSPSGQ